METDVFFPDLTKAGSKKKEREAKVICNNCSVRLECLDYALDANEEFGVWGGMTTKERKLIRRHSVVMATETKIVTVRKHDRNEV
jgi:WhiB family redox-sensing transcriptional regulator